MLVLAALVAGCATRGTALVADSRASLDKRIATPLRELAFAPMPMAEWVRGDLDDRASVVAIDGRPVYARGFVLPDHAGVLELSVRSYLLAATLDETAGYSQGPSAAEPVDDAYIGRHCPRLAAAAPYFNEGEWNATFAAGLDALFARMEATQPVAKPKPSRRRRQPRGPRS